MPHLLVFGPGYTASRFIDAVAARGWTVDRVGRAAAAGRLAIDDPTVPGLITRATHILSSVPPADGADPVLVRHRDALAASAAAWIGYLSSTGVYGDVAGAWVDETAPVGGGRRDARAAADLAWATLHREVRRFRLPGIYGPGRSPLDRVAGGAAHRVDAPGQVFSRVHVDDIVGGLLASLDRPPGAYNLADDLPASQNAVVEHAARLLGLPPPPFVPLASLSPMARGFYAENRRVANGRAKRLLGWSPLYPTYREGLRALIAITSPASTSTAPAIALGDQR